MKNVIKFSVADALGNSRAFVFLRITFGILLFTKGIDFINTDLPIGPLQFQQEPLFVASFYAATGWAQLAGAIFIIVGLFTRTACFVQLLIVTLELLIRFSSYTLSDGGLAETIIILSGLIFFLLKGAGNISLDRFFKFYKSEHLVFWA